MRRTTRLSRARLLNVVDFGLCVIVRFDVGVGGDLFIENLTLAYSCLNCR